MAEGGRNARVMKMPLLKKRSGHSSVVKGGGSERKKGEAKGGVGGSTTSQKRKEGVKHFWEGLGIGESAKIRSQ